MARTLIENLAGPFNPEEFRDAYREALLQIVEKKIAGEEIEIAAEEAPAARVVDLMEALKASVEAVKKKPPAEPKAAKRKAAPKRKAAAG
jgi:DNA end-binding protein Ku